MLKLENIVKNYYVGGQAVRALKGISLSFRDSEFVSVLGQSGCGKTTLLNIIGGLDHFTSGDLFIDGRSTKDFKDRDWDAYRNHSVGFVFQSYNLIPHQTVLSNVELALTLSGVSKSERKKRAKAALEQVGLADQMYKRPNQISGGQMQRVAIARALVNDPKILLADEPTGALDSETSVQVMEILKEIARDKLVIMVTHNPELAQEYSSRIVRLLDGEVIDDSAPFDGGETEPDVEQAGRKAAREKQKTHMSFLTALSLSFKNLLTKKGRTFMTSFAGSIGIIGIALILSVSQGVKAYIDTVQEETLSSYPITIEAESVDMSSLLKTITDNAEKQPEHERDAVYSSSRMYDLVNAMNGSQVTKNNLVKFKKYLEDKDSDISKYVSAIHYGYNLNLNIYTKNGDGEIIKSDMNQLMDIMTGNAEYSSLTKNNSLYSSWSTIRVWEEMLPGTGDELTSKLVKDQYDMVYGSWPKDYNELVLVVDKNNEVSDVSLYALGLVSSDEIKKTIEAAYTGEKLEFKPQKWSYKDICNMDFRLVPSSDYYQYDSNSGTYSDISTDSTGMNYLYDNAIKLKVSGIIRPNEDANSTMLSGSIGYTAALTEYVVGRANNSAVVKDQMKKQDTDVISGLKFDDGSPEPTEKEKAAALKEHFKSLSTPDKAATYTQIMKSPTDEYLDNAVEQATKGLTRDQIEQMLLSSAKGDTSMNEESLKGYISDMDDETLKKYFAQMLREKTKSDYAERMEQAFAAMTTAQMAQMFDAQIEKWSDADLAALYAEYMPKTVSDSTYEDNLKMLGYIDLGNPSNINIYAATFADKDTIGEMIDGYNNGKDDADKITYTDYIKLLMSSITTIINAISYVLIAFVAISLIVSSIMIGIITYISVLERTKEIGILRAVGASKRDISRVFNAETMIVGFTAGVIGILITLVLIIAINVILHTLTGIATLNAVLPPVAAVILVIISMLLTLTAGLIPSRVAANKDPVVALRTE